MQSYEQFPVYVPLCQAVEVRGNWVSFCIVVEKEDGLCVWHRAMRKEGTGVWSGREVSLGVPAMAGAGT
jgi:hypothetical protein